MSKLKLPFIAILSLTVLLLGLYGIHLLIGEDSSAPSMSIGEKQETNTAFQLDKQILPDFTLTSTQGGTINSESFHDKPMFIMEWASWCSYCQEQMPFVQEVFDQYSDRVNFVLINATGFDGETPEAAQAYITQKGYTFPWYIDQGLTTADILKVESTPTIFVVDKNQTVQTVFTSVQTKESLEAAIKQVLN
ncbi:TlpA family protein disulfide reductase [Streptococcus ovuberis]|uniref:TlpA family protein disulfide reductase n=1 Tax=Streptococcus ovuberis TaxID=1936207 RepID=A0A7X6N0D2_9STRE|nr:TlpA disulfide reductase family protein [Streptococcus ovuberis]NKZ21186.1 TlpA family protein disulfide reductase [Streptococcus ovuberis]